MRHKVRPSDQAWPSSQPGRLPSCVCTVQAALQTLQLFLRQCSMAPLIDGNQPFFLARGGPMGVTLIVTSFAPFLRVFNVCPCCWHFFWKNVYHVILFPGYQVCPKIPGSSILGHFARESVRLAYLQGSILINPEKCFFFLPADQGEADHAAATEVVLMGSRVASLLHNGLIETF